MKRIVGLELSPAAAKISPKNITLPTHGKPKMTTNRSFSYDLIAQDGSTEIGVLAKFIDVFGLSKQIEIARHDFNKFNSCYKTFLNAGYPWPKDIEQCKQLHQSCCNAPPGKWIIRLLRRGWFRGRYMHPNVPRMINGKQYVCVAGPFLQPMPEGSPAEWHQLATYAAHSPTMVLALSLVFGTAFLRLTNVRNVGFYWSSESALERTAFIKTVTSLDGGPGNVQLWNKSRSEIDSIACYGNDFAFCSEYPVDELKLVKRLPDVISQLHLSQHRLFYSLVGERPLTGALRHGSKKLVSLALNCDPEFGMCESLPAGCSGSTDLLKKVVKLTQHRNYGGVFRQFTDALEESGEDKIKHEVIHEMMAFMQELQISDPAEREFATVFAIAFAGAVIAARMKLLPWSRDRTLSLIARCYHIARGETIGQSIPVQLEDEDIERLRSMLRGPAVLFLPWQGNKTGSTVEEVQKAEAFWRKEPHPAGYLVPPETLSRWCGVEKTRLLILWLKTNGFLITEKARLHVNTYQCHIMGRSRHFYVIDESFVNPEPNPTSVKNSGHNEDPNLLEQLTSQAPPAKDEEQSSPRLIDSSDNSVVCNKPRADSCQ